MRNSYLKDGTPIIVCSTKSLVSITVYATALTNKFYRESLDFPLNLTKNNAVKILREELKFHGQHGEYQTGFFEAATDVADVYNSVYEMAENWVSKNYPHLIKTK